MLRDSKLLSFHEQWYIFSFECGEHPGDVWNVNVFYPKCELKLKRFWYSQRIILYIKLSATFFFWSNKLYVIAV